MTEAPEMADARKQSWSVRVGDAVRAQLSAIVGFEYDRITPVDFHGFDDDAIAVTFRNFLHGQRVGIRVSRDEAQDRDIESLAALLVYVGILEPRRIEDFSAADDQGVRWLDVSEWLPLS